MALTAAQLKDAGRDLAQRINRTGVPMPFSTTDLEAAVTHADTVLDSLPSALDPAQAIAEAFLLGFPEPFKTQATLEQRALAVIVVVQRRAGISTL